MCDPIISYGCRRHHLTDILQQWWAPSIEPQHMQQPTSPHVHYTYPSNCTLCPSYPQLHQPSCTNPVQKQHQASPGQALTTRPYQQPAA
mmetsp:Transcript_34185/g.86469  ORF Transcript_34185/g.86469 Transcript_34185/m.86469 type:complete len:89 (+) Transcript_34185:2369-2635(+)